MEEKIIHLNRVRSHLIKLARQNQTITYRQLETVCQIPNQNKRERNFYFFDLLVHIGNFETMFNRPPINSLVYSVKDKRPGQGFYDWARVMLKITSKKKIEYSIFLLNKWKQECNDYWSIEENYQKYSGDFFIKYE